MITIIEGFGQTALVFLSSAAACIALGPAAIRALRKAQFVQPFRHEDCPSLASVQIGKEGTPTMGGLLVLGASTAVAAIAGGLESRVGMLVCACVLGFGALGLLDDLLKFRGPNGRGLRTLPKLLITILLAFLLAWGLFTATGGVGRIDWPGRSYGVSLGLLWIPFAALVFVGTSHAVNLTDGMDGLAAGCLFITLSAFLLIRARAGTDPVVNIWCAALAGACAGFLWFNSFPASVFLGDVGAMGLGAALAAISLLHQSPFWLMWIGAIFVVEALSVMAQVAAYKWLHRRIFRVAPLHHHFQVAGVSEPKLIAQFWLVNVALVIIGVALWERV